jgi:hypothetical protein
MLLAASPTASSWTLVGGGGLLVLYAAFLLAFDRCISTHPSRDLLVQTLDGLRDCAGWPRPEVDANDPPSSKAAERFDEVKSSVNDAIESARRQLQSTRNLKAAQKNPDAPKRYATVIDTALVLAIWRQAHRLDCVCWSVAPDEAAKEHLSTVMSQLKALDRPDAKNLVTQAAAADTAEKSTQPEQTLRLGPLTLTKPAVKEKSDPHPLLQEALTVFYDDRDTTFESLADTQSKASWLGILGVALIAIAALTSHREELLVFGAIGALLSRSLGLLGRKPGGNYYGVSAAVFTLAPVIGALSGWAGVAIVQGLNDLKVLSPTTFGSVWTSPTSTKSLAIAFAFGFVERLIDRVAQSTADAVPGPDKTKTTTPTKPSAPATTPTAPTPVTDT